VALQEMKSSAEAANPLLEERFPIPFQRIKAEHVQPAVEQLLIGMKARVDAIGSKQTPRTYEGVLAALDRATLPLDYAMAIVRHLESVATTPQFRAAHNAVQGPVSAFYSSIPLHPDLWSAVKAVSESAGAKGLTGVHKRFLEKTVAGFRRAGADL